MKKENRQIYSDTITTMMIDRKYIAQSFYSFMLVKCNLVIDDKFTAIAGVRFNMSTVQYDLKINSVLFKLLTQEERLAVLVHECRHILGNHTVRKGERDHDMFNQAADIAINQTIGLKLPEGALFPEMYNFQKGLNAEQYYELLKQKKEDEKEDKDEDENKDQDCKGKPGSGSGQKQKDALQEALENGDLEKIKEMLENGEIEIDEDLPQVDSNGNEVKGTENQQDVSGMQEEIMKEITKSMVKDAAEKSKGNVPQDYSDILDLWNTPPKVSWKRELRRIMASIASGKKPTSKRSSRRFGQRADIKGKCRDIAKKNIISGLDISGSMDDGEIYQGLVEVNGVAKTNNGSLSLCQIDTRIAGIEEFNINQKTFHRKGCGGTYMGSMPEYIMENNIKCDVLIMISDMYIEDVDTDPIWAKFKKPVIWLNTSGAGNGVTITKKGHKVINFTDM